MPRRCLPWVAVALVVAALVAGCGAGDPHSPALAPPLTRHPSVVGGTLLQRRLVERVLARLGASSVRSVVIGPASRLIRTRLGPPRELYVRGPTSVRGGWDSELLASALVVAGLQGITAINASDSEGPITASWPPVQERQQPPAALTQQRFAQRFKAAAARSRASVLELRLIRGEVPALAATLAAANPARFLKQHSAALLELWHTEADRVPASYIGLEDAHGRLLWALGRFPNQGSYYVLPQLDACDHIEHGQSLGAKTYPCPA